MSGRFPLNLLLFALLSFTLPVQAAPLVKGIQEGDVVFQETSGFQSIAVAQATKSKWTHCGIIVSHKGKWFVLEASRQVILTPLGKFVNGRGGGEWAVFRYRKPISDEQWKKASAYALQQVGKPYDYRFDWGEESQYCSELVWKVFKAGGVSLCEPQNFGDYLLDSPDVKGLIEARYGDTSRLPQMMKVVAPSDLAESKLLRKIFEGQGQR